MYRWLVSEAKHGSNSGEYKVKLELSCASGKTYAGGKV